MNSLSRRFKDVAYIEDVKMTISAIINAKENIQKVGDFVKVT